MAMVIVDTGILYAIADRDDAWHEPVRSYLQAQGDTLLVPVTVLPEACYLLNQYLGRAAERRCVLSILQDEIKIEGF